MAKKRATRADGRTSRGTFAPGRSGNPSGVSLRETLLRAAGNNQQRGDDWQNAFTGQGMYGRDKRVGAQFASHVLSFDQLKDLWLGDDLAARAVETIPREAMRQGYDISIASGQVGESSAMDPSELAAEITQKLNLLGIDEYLEVCGGYERGFGGGALLLGANDGEADLTKPLNLQRVKTFDWVTPLEARELMPLYAYGDPRAPKYGQPEVYQLSSRAVLPTYSGNYASSTMMIHESRLIVFPGIRVSRYQTTTARGGWGESVLSRVFRVLRDFNTAWSSAGILVSDFGQSVIKIAGLWEALALDGNKAFQKRLEAMELGRSAINALTIDAGDSYERQQTPLSGLSDLLEKFAVRLAAACDMPLTLLFGTSPAGMNATGESDVRFFYDRVAAYQTRKLEPAIRRICQIVFRTIGNKREPDRWAVKFRPLWQDSAKDKAAAMLTQAQADTAWITAGVLSPEEVALAHWGKGEYDPNLTIDFESRDTGEPAAPGPVAQESEDDYVPPPPPGSAQPGEPVPAPSGEAAAPDPNTPPKNIILAEDSADLVRDAWSEEAREAALEARQANAKGKPEAGGAGGAKAAAKAAIAKGKAATAARPAPGRKSTNTKEQPSALERAKAGETGKTASPKSAAAKASDLAGHHEATAKQHEGFKGSDEHAKQAQEEHGKAAAAHTAAGEEHMTAGAAHAAAGDHTKAAASNKAARESFKKAIESHNQAAGGKDKEKGKEHKAKGESLGKKLSELTKGAGEVVAGKESAKLAETVAPGSEGGGEGE